MLLRALSVVCATVLICPRAVAQEGLTDSDRLLIAALEDYIPHAMRRHQTPGLNLALARRGEVIWEKGFGYADWDAKLPMTPSTVFHSGSMGKTYTATAIMQLVERGVIGLHDPINEYLAEFQVENPFGERDVTFHDLLTHRSGLTGNAAGSDFIAPTPLGHHLKEGYAADHFKSYEGSVLPRWSVEVGTRMSCQGRCLLRRCRPRKSPPRGAC